MSARRIFAGIDPGLSGALAAISEAGELLALASMPTMPHGKTRRVSGAALARWCESLQAAGPVALVVLEQVASRPGQGAPSVFTFGRAYGAVEAILSATGLPLDYVTPATWKRTFSLTSAKGESIRKACDLFPALVHQRAGKGPTHDQAEATLLAEYARRRWSGQN